MRRISLAAVLLAVCMLFSWPTPAQEVPGAIRAGDLARVKALVEKDPGLVSVKNPAGETPLFDAVRAQRPEIAEYLLAKGAAVDAENNFHMTALHVACRGGLPLDLVRLLVEKGADVNAVSKYQGRPLDMAGDRDDRALVEYLKSKGAAFTPLTFETFKLAGGVHRLAFPWGMRNNLVVQSGPDGVLVVDSGFSKRAVEAVKKTIAGFAAGDIKLVVNTHSNWDHIAGNALAPSEAAVLGYAKLGGGSFQPALAREAGPLRGRSGLELPAPFAMRFNGDDVQIVPYPGLHSQDDILIHFRSARVLCMGDLLLSESCPAIGDVPGYMELLDKVLDVFPDGTTFVSGHGKDLTWQGLRKYRDDLRSMIALVKKNRDAGKGADDMVRDDILKSYKADYSHLDWLGPDWWIRGVSKSLDSGRLK